MNRLRRVLIWPVGFIYGFIVGGSRAFVAEFRHAYRRQRGRL